MLKASKGEQGLRSPPELLLLRGSLWPRGYTTVPCTWSHITTQIQLGTLRQNTNVFFIPHGSPNTDQMTPVVFKQKGSTVFQRGKKTIGRAGFPEPAPRSQSTPSVLHESCDHMHPSPFSVILDLTYKQCNSLSWECSQPHLTKTPHVPVGKQASQARHLFPRRILHSS